MIIVCTTVGTKADAQKVARFLIEEKYAACVNIIHIEQSVYCWKNKLVEAPEFLLIVKTAREFKEIESAIKKNHPYELPEIMEISVRNGLPDYLEWVENATR